MKSIALLGCMWMMAGSAQLMATPAFEEAKWSQSQMVSLCDLNDRLIQEFFNGNRRDLIVECPEGASLAFKLALKGEFLALESASVPPLYLKVLKTCYIRCEERENFLFSTDLQTWRGFSEFFTGLLKASVEMENAGLVAGLQFELNQRKT